MYCKLGMECHRDPSLALCNSPCAHSPLDDIIRKHGISFYFDADKTNLKTKIL